MLVSTTFEEVEVDPTNEVLSINGVDDVEYDEELQQAVVAFDPMEFSIRDSTFEEDVCRAKSEIRQAIQKAAMC